jgi:hypothetical protein
MSVAFAMSAGATAAVYAAAGVSLGLALGGFFVAAIVLPPMLAIAPEATCRGATFAAAMAGISLVWLGLIGPSHATSLQWVMLAVVLIGFAGVVAGMTLILRSLLVVPALAAAIATVAAMLWLTWPIWLSSYLGEGELQWLVVLHPPLVANGLLTFTVPWTEQAIAYHLTILNQDVPIRLPGNPMICIVVHAMVGAMLIGLSLVTERQRTQ